jgi:hypothetical protein
MKRKVLMLFIAAIVGATTGCKSRLAFVTQTSLGLDVSGTASYPNKVSFSYGRYEGAIVPRKTDGSNEGHSVYGGMNSDVKFSLPPKYRIDQVFATGDAAIIAARRDTNDADGNGRTKGDGTRAAGKPCECQPGGPHQCGSDTKPLVFLTSTTLGVHFTAGEQEANPSALVGYRRREATMIPIADSSKEVQSVYADIHLSSRELDAKNRQGADAADKRAIAEQNDVSQWGGVKIRQSFATGEAAKQLAKNAYVQNKLSRAAKTDQTAAVLRDNKAVAADVVSDMKKELDRLADAKLVDAVSALKTSGVFSATDYPDAANAAKTAPRTLCRDIKAALDTKIQFQFTDEATLAQLKAGLGKLKQIQN